MSIESILQDNDKRRVCIMIVVELVVFAVVLGLLPLFKVDTYDIEKTFGIYGFDADRMHPNFHSFESIAGFVFLIIMWSTWRVYHKEYTMGSICLISLKWILIAAVGIYIGASLGSGSIWNYHAGGACWSARIVYPSPFVVVWCGLGYALPVGIGAAICRHIYDQNQAGYVTENEEENSSGSGQKFLGMFTLCVTLLILSFILSFILNMVMYMIVS